MTAWTFLTTSSLLTWSFNSRKRFLILKACALFLILQVHYSQAYGIIEMKRSASVSSLILEICYCCGVLRPR